MHGSRMDTFPRCARCGDAIGVYEPVWWELSDGSITDSGLLALGYDPGRHSDSRFYHRGCLAPEEVPRES
jgi:hypothetical protein